MAARDRRAARRPPRGGRAQRALRPGQQRRGVQRAAELRQRHLSHHRAEGHAGAPRRGGPGGAGAQHAGAEVAQRGGVRGAAPGAGAARGVLREQRAQGGVRAGERRGDGHGSGEERRGAVAEAEERVARRLAEGVRVGEGHDGAGARGQREAEELAARRRGGAEDVAAGRDRVRGGEEARERRVQRVERVQLAREAQARVPVGRAQQVVEVALQREGRDRRGPGRGPGPGPGPALEAAVLRGRPRGRQARRSVRPVRAPGRPLGAAVDGALRVAGGPVEAIRQEGREERHGRGAVGRARRAELVPLGRGGDAVRRRLRGGGRARQAQRDARERRAAEQAALVEPHGEAGRAVEQLQAEGGGELNRHARPLQVPRFCVTDALPIHKKLRVQRDPAQPPAPGELIGRHLPVRRAGPVAAEPIHGLAGAQEARTELGREGRDLPEAAHAPVEHGALLLGERLVAAQQAPGARHQEGRVRRQRAQRLGERRAAALVPPQDLNAQRRRRYAHAAAPSRGVQALPAGVDGAPELRRGGGVVVPLGDAAHGLLEQPVRPERLRKALLRRRSALSGAAAVRAAALAVPEAPEVPAGRRAPGPRALLPAGAHLLRRAADVERARGVVSPRGGGDPRAVLAVEVPQPRELAVLVAEPRVLVERHAPDAHAQLRAPHVALLRRADAAHRSAGTRGHDRFQTLRTRF